MKEEIKKLVIDRLREEKDFTALSVKNVIGDNKFIGYPVIIYINEGVDLIISEEVFYSNFDEYIDKENSNKDWIELKYKGD